MDIVETRRANLRRWVATNGTPEKEKSLFSQLKATASFGEKVARRLEKQYRMGSGYLDTPDGQVASPESAGNGEELPDSMKLTIETAPELRLLSTYRIANAEDRKAIDGLVNAIRKRSNAGGNEREA